MTFYKINVANEAGIFKLWIFDHMIDKSIIVRIVDFMLRRTSWTVLYSWFDKVNRGRGSNLWKWATII